MKVSYEETMKRLISEVSSLLEQLAFETVHVLRMPPTLRLSVSMERLKTGLQPSLVWTLSTIRGIYGDKTEADLGKGRDR
ncbi:uncharacterized protein MONOS_6922 [Monocercomonoides exilis]|uniref:uncharacterized protein n=1 Tax=Monocercomonoides exilis TaxID=2049356 RepID=UPI00355A38A1|nr:hypothetical protein MONOS_6922 [Monocercomonoides exilis]|eukprot:MONOS_6922.1-p1 / transcript=MONOS_6922.1 / gene=MONOS_6922 / organism=Monocercomonoides_exilis_PA203 / gene_product=unspecified product / transcript_product=unspecified product / location=Mono_scaffold00227:21993-22232(+) / protein_length=80 / sequence_SO=supercontig / SO=protein_coding / is_pseudo=false